jgi:Crinkler effector protein N-terminal domain
MRDYNKREWNNQVGVASGGGKMAVYHQPPAKWTIFCLVFDEYSPFSVKIQPDATVDDLKDAIKAKKQPQFDGFAADSLTLYLVNLPEDDNLVENVKQLLTVEPPLVSLKATKQLSVLFPGVPAAETVHILVKTPSIGK